MRLRLLAAGVAGVAGAASMPPGHVPLMAVVLAVVFALVATAPGVRSAFFVGAAFAIPFFALHILWLPASFSVLLGDVFWPLFPLLVAALAAIWGVTTAAARGLTGGGGATLAWLVPGWVFVEWLRGLGFLGFPWGSVGYTWLDTPVAQWADVLGVHGLGVLTTLLAALLAAPFVSTPRRRDGFRYHYRYGFSTLGTSRGSRVGVRRWLAWPLAVALVTLAWWGGVQRDAAVRASMQPPDRSALLVQGDVDPFGRAAGAALELDVHLDLTRAGVREGVDLVVWPEGAILSAPLEGFRGEPIRAMLRESAPDAAFVVGGRADVPGGSANAVFGVEEGTITGRYDKHVLVPFGERWPLLEAAAPLYRAIFGLFGLPLLTNTVPGPGPAPLAVNGASVAAYVCYESVFPRIPRRMVEEGAGVLINVTNDAWFARGNGAEQHFDMGRLRAIETRRWLLRAGNDGITAVVDPTGRTVASLPRGVRDTLVVSYAERRDVTGYVRYGAAIPWLLGLASLLMTLWGAARRW